MLWRLRRSTAIETGLFQIQGELMQDKPADVSRPNIPLPQWYDEMDVGAGVRVSTSIGSTDRGNRLGAQSDSSQTLACCFLRVSRLGYGTLDLLTRYETALWRQAAQLLFMLQSVARR